MEPLNRRQLIRSTATLAGATWLTPVGQWLARASEGNAPGALMGDSPRAQSVIVLWMSGGPTTAPRA